MVSRDADEIDNQGDGTAGSASPVSPILGRTARSLGEDSSGFPPVDFPLHLADSANYYSAQSRLDHHEAPYSASSSRNQPRIRQVIPAVPTQAGPPQYGVGMQSSPLQQHNTAPWQVGQVPQESVPTMGNAAAAYYSHLHPSQVNVNPAYPQERGDWSQRPPVPARASRGGYHHNIAQIDVTGQRVDGTAWPSDRLPGAPVASAPPLTTPMVAGLPAGRGREHLRTRSFPPTWPWAQDGSGSAQYPPHGPHSAFPPDDDGSGSTASHLNQR